MSDVPPYWIDPNKDEYEVSIGSVTKHNDLYHIQIEENVMRPAGGGQAGDRGRLTVGDQNVMILDTISDSNGVILVTDRDLPEGVVGHLEIDMEWRSAMMRNHTAEHLFARIIKTEHEDINIGELWIDGKHGSVELVGQELTLDTIFEAEQEVLRIIEQDLVVKTDIVDSESIDSSIRSREGLTEKHAKLRVVSVGDIDRSACSGIHVSRTGDIAFFKVLDVKWGEKSTRVEFVAGVNAGRVMASTYNTALRRKYSYPFEMEQLGPVLDRAKIAIDEKQKMIDKTTQLITSGPTVEKIEKISFRHEYLPGYDATSLKNLANQLQSTSPIVFLLFAPGKKSQVILRVIEMPNDASDYISRPLTNMGGRGGGKGEVFTGGFVDVEDPLTLYESLVDEVRKCIE